jgi:hypothetical protein
MPGISVSLAFLLFFCLLLALTFEFINGFHDTANAVATVIYTHALKPGTAVVWSGIWNFIGVNIGGIAVAIGIVNLLPVEALTDTNIQHNLAMVIKSSVQLNGSQLLFIFLNDEFLSCYFFLYILLERLLFGDFLVSIFNFPVCFLDLLL